MTKTITYEYEEVEIVFDKKKPMDNPLDDFYTPPEGINMSSAEAYAEWLSNNIDETISYEAKAKIDDDEVNMKYVYKDGVICLAFYDENKNITSYQEWTYFTDSESGQEKVLIKSYDVKNKTYSESEQLNDYTFFISKHNLLCFAETMPFFFLNFPEINLPQEIPSNIKITREIKKVSNGVYNLKTNIKDTQTKTTNYVQFVVKNDRIISYGSGNSSAYVTIATFDYDNVSIDFDKNGYTKLEA